MKKAEKHKRARRRLPRLGNLVLGGVLAAAAGFVVVLIVAVVIGDEPPNEFASQIIETQSESDGKPFQGGPKLHFPVASIDMGHVPLNTNVSYAFAMANVGDDAAHIEDVDVSVLEGC